MPRVTAQIPTAPVTVPAVVRELAGDDDVVPVWRNELGGLTFRLGEARFVKWVQAGTPELDLAAEAARLAWAAPYTPVPRVLEAGHDATGAWLVTAALPGRSAVDPARAADPDTTVRAIGAGLRALHDALPVADCPFTWSAADRVGRVASADRHRVADPPAVERLVVCHGDACAPNTLVDDAGRWTGHVDLDCLGVADRWADLAVASYSLAWNYDADVAALEAAFFDAYGIAPDTERIAYYRLLWDLG